MTHNHKALAWAMFAALACLIAYVSFGGYLSPALLFDFANSPTC